MSKNARHSLSRSTRDRLPRGAALLTAATLALATALTAAAPATAEPLAPLQRVTQDGITYEIDLDDVDAGARVSAFDPAAAPSLDVTVLGSVVIPDAGGESFPVTAIGPGAFNETGIESVTLPDGLRAIGEFAFAQNVLGHISIPDSVTAIEAGAFLLNRLTSVRLPEGLTEIAEAAFYHNDLRSIAIPATVEAIGESAFSYNRLEALTLPDSVSSIGHSGFLLNSLTSVGLGQGLSSIGPAAFAGNALDSVSIPAGVHTIGGLAFALNSPEFLTRPDPETFDFDDVDPLDSTLADVTFLGPAPTSFQPAGRDNGHDNSTEVLPSLGEGHGLLVSYPGGLESTGFSEPLWQGYASAAYTPSEPSCPGSASGSETTTAIAGIHYAITAEDASAGASVTHYDAACGPHVAIPDSVEIPLGSGILHPVTGVGDSAFFGKALSTVLLPSTLTVIAGDAFAENELTDISLPEGLLSIGDSAFDGNRLGRLVIPDSVTLIDLFSFANNEIATLTLGRSVEEIGASAFANNRLSSVTIPTGVHTIGGWAFGAHPQQLQQVQVQPMSRVGGNLRASPTALTTVVFEGPAPSDFQPRNGTENPDDTGASAGSLGSGDGLSVHYPVELPGWERAGARWQGYSAVPYVTVDFAMGAHGTQTPAQRVSVGDKPEMPFPAPTAAGFTFTGWFADTALATTFDFDLPVTASTTVHAGWKAAHGKPGDNGGDNGDENGDDNGDGDNGGGDNGGGAAPAGTGGGTNQAGTPVSTSAAASLVETGHSGAVGVTVATLLMLAGGLVLIARRRIRAPH